MNKSISSPKGFTMIELLIVIVLIGALVGLFTPFAASVRSGIAMSQSLKQVKSDLLYTMSYSMAGKSLAALEVKADQVKLDKMPSHYALYFTEDTLNADEPNSYYYLETGGADPSVKVIYQIKKEPPNSTVLLEDIRLYDKDNKITDANSALIFFTPPFGKVNIADGNLLGGITPVKGTTLGFNPLASNVYKRVEMDIKYKYQDPTEKAIRATISFGVDKVMEVQ